MENQAAAPAGKTKRFRISAGMLLLLTGTSVFYLEVLLKYFIGRPVYYSGILLSLLFGGALATALTGLILLLPPKAARILTAVTMFILSLLYASQMVYHSIFQNFYTLYSAGNAGRVMEFAGEALYAIKVNILPILLFFLPFFLLLALQILGRGPARLPLKRLPAVLGAALVLHLAGFGLVNLDNRGEISPYTLYYRVYHPELAVNHLGLVTYLRLDLQRSLLEREPIRLRPAPTEPVETGPTDQPPTLPTTTAATTQNTAAPLTPTVTPTPPAFNMLDIDFDALLKEETDPELRELHEYFRDVSPTQKNAYTGRFEGYNLIFLCAEAFSHLAVREDVTPTLYKMTHEGFYFPNFYTSYWGVSTSDGEYVATTGLVPKNGAWSYSQSSDNLMPFALGNQLRRLDYTTFAYHNHTYTYYDRHLSHPNMGYEFKGIGNGLDVRKIWPASDLEMMEVTVPDYMDSEPFHAYYMTVSGHLRYNFYGNNMAMKNEDVVADLPYSEAARAYLATQVELDRALEHLLDELEQRGIAEKTLFVLSADHYPYGLTHEENEELAGKELDPDFELYHNGLILYAPGMEPETVTRPASSMDILPTVLNLMGLPYDSRLLMGRDVFSDAAPLVFFYDRSFISDVGRYNAKTDTFMPVPGIDATETELDSYRRQVSRIIDDRFRMSEQILDLDYYRVLFPDGALPPETTP